MDRNDQKIRRARRLARKAQDKERRPLKRLGRVLHRLEALAR